MTQPKRAPQTPLWMGGEPPVDPPKSAADKLRLGLRGLAIGLLLSGGLVVLLLLRLIERPIHGAARPWTPSLTRVVCRLTIAIIGIRYKVRGTPMHHIGAVVANHSSWLDIFALNACQRVYFVSKEEVARWPFVGWLAQATGTVFIRRDPRQAKAQQAVFEARIRAGHHLLFFPEGTSTDGLQVLPFKTTLFQAFYTHGLDRVMQIQPVSVIYHAPKGEDPRYYGWWRDMAFATHLAKVLAAPRQGEIEVVFHDPLNVADYPSRKELAAACEVAVRAGVDQALSR
ncbi:1-acyl-sn-glycerol-3-phosphate acyltransferase [Rhodobacter aestuarii]|uniref:Lyso-ornithine lipid acyltransferase n=1 Tax=Rhodobacter aestuarii TaxID=453582 RepID=A0A1N7MX09_9RHOB|nr:1-acyl-sn-glycerol-3-phosphate acyltransferase [Rhodobacter aestuarii]SIS90657.1 lyso-ornithine lipid acyltransferase [Rhodobacter aestuarii]